MKRLLLSMILVFSAGHAVAGEATRLTPGGATIRDAVRSPLAAEPSRVELLRTKNFAAGTMARRDAAPSLFGGHSLEVGSYLEYDTDYKFDATLRSGAAGTTRGIGAGYGATLDQTNTSYLLRFGTDWSEPSRGDGRFSLNPAAASPIDSEEAGRDLNLSLTLTHSFTPNLFLNGTAAARRTLESDQTVRDNQFLLGAGLGYRF